VTDTPDDAAERTKQLAKKLLEALDAPTDPEKEARLAEKEARDKEALEKYYRETHQPPPAKAQRARSVEEMRFAMSLEPCPACQLPDTRLTPDERDDRKARRERYSRDWLTSERDRLLALATQTGGR
jgi:hypothetical protein